MGRLSLALILSVLALANVQAQERDNRESFDYGRLELRRVGDRWQLLQGHALFKDLGTSETDAREALNIIRELRLNEHGTVGSRIPVMEYWLADHQAPRGIVPPQQLVSIDRSTLRAESLHGQWCLRDARQVLFNFGRYEQDARDALAIVQRYSFNRIGYVGFPQPILIYFLDSTEASSTKPSHLTAASAPITAINLWQVRQLSPMSPVPFDPATGEERVALDWRQVELRRDGSTWKLILAGQCIADFGTNEIDAREALRVFQFYRFNELARVGPSTKPFSYYLVNGQAPHGLRFGVNNLSFHPDRLFVRQIDGQWMICEEQRPIFRGGDTQEEARQVLQAIQRYKFDNLCRIGDAEKGGLKFMVRER
jgi:hypothetical protein